jgi:hypothetical protein
VSSSRMSASKADVHTSPSSVWADRLSFNIRLEATSWPRRSRTIRGDTLR